MTTTYRQLLVHLDGAAAAPARLRCAREIAARFGASVAALYATAPAFVELPYAGVLAPSAATGLAEADQAWLEQTRAAFDQALRTPGPGVSWAQTSEVPLAGAFVQQALFADLLVLGQRDPRDPRASGLPPDFAESVVIASGRPALLVPYVGWRGAVGESIAIAWKETREAARAVAAAMPLLQRAARVHVLAWGEDAQPALEGERLGLKGWLALHGVEPTWHREPAEAEPLGEMLLSRVFDLGADLLVMGCYGHSRARELVLGGTSRTVLRSMTLPVLMAH